MNGVIAHQDDCLIAISDGVPLPTAALLALPPWRAVLLARVADRAGVRLERGTLSQLVAEASAVGGDGRLGEWWQRAVSGVELTPAEQRGRYKAGVDVLLVPCPRCGVVVGERCRIEGRNYAHRARYDAIVRAVLRGQMPNELYGGRPGPIPERPPGATLADPPREPPAGRYRWPKESAPSARGLSPEEARAEAIGQMEKARDAAATDEVRAQAEAMLDILRTLPFGWSADQS